MYDTDYFSRWKEGRNENGHITYTNIYEYII
jgi:hypothetical protein